MQMIALFGDEASGLFSLVLVSSLGFLQCFDAGWLTGKGRRASALEGLHHLSPEVLFRNRWKTEGGQAGPGSPGG